MKKTNVLYKNITVFGNKIMNKDTSANQDDPRSLTHSSDYVLNYDSSLFNKEEFDKELNEIKRLVSRNRDLRNECYQLEKESNELVEKFIEKHSEFKPIIGKYSTYVNKSINANQFMSIVESQNLLPEELAMRIRLLTRDSRTINHNVDKNVKLMEEYGEMLGKIDSVEVYSESNVLLPNQYLIEDEFRNLLNNA
jgi:hypothetical protein